MIKWFIKNVKRKKKLFFFFSKTEPFCRTFFPLDRFLLYILLFNNTFIQTWTRIVRNVFGLMRYSSSATNNKYVGTQHYHWESFTYRHAIVLLRHTKRTIQFKNSIKLLTVIIKFIHFIPSRWLRFLKI